MKEWAKQRGVAADNILMLSDASGSFSEALGYLQDAGEMLGKRSTDYALVLDQVCVGYI